MSAETLAFLTPAPNASRAVLGVIASRAPDTRACEVLVPAHALATLNITLGGRLHLLAPAGVLPVAFATGAQAKHRRYRLDPGTVLISALLRADALAPELVRAGVNAWLPAQQLFAHWRANRVWKPAQWQAAAQALLVCAVQTAQGAQHADEPALRQALRSMQHASVADTAQALRMSERALQRLFASRMGLSPKRVQRMVRIQQALQRWRGPHDDAPTTLAELAADCGLSDQAHLAREFRELIGHAPRVLKSGAVELAPQMMVFRQSWSAFV